jgi:hypothetical protein
VDPSADSTTSSEATIAGQIPDVDYEVLWRASGSDNALGFVARRLVFLGHQSGAASSVFANVAE